MKPKLGIILTMSRKHVAKEARPAYAHAGILSHIFQGRCDEILRLGELTRLVSNSGIALTFLDPPFNQGKEYKLHNDKLPSSIYWEWMRDVCKRMRELSIEGGALYFMQREKNTEEVLRCIREAGWTLENLIIWKKKTSAVPGRNRFGKAYQVIAFATNGERARVFHRLRIDPPRLPEHKFDRETGMYVTDVWDDIRELTSGFFAGDEPLRHPNGRRFHDQQAPIALLARIILSSTNPGDWVCDPFAGTGTTNIVAEQLQRPSIGIELDPENIAAIGTRLSRLRHADDLENLFEYYRFTDNLGAIWGKLLEVQAKRATATKQLRMPIPIEETG